MPALNQTRGYAFGYTIVVVNIQGSLRGDSSFHLQSRVNYPPKSQADKN